MRQSSKFHTSFPRKNIYCAIGPKIIQYHSCSFWVNEKIELAADRNIPQALITNCRIKYGPIYQ